jgi:hypothetical protein
MSHDMDFFKHCGTGIQTLVCLDRWITSFQCAEANIRQTGFSVLSYYVYSFQDHDFLDDEPHSDIASRVVDLEHSLLASDYLVCTDKPPTLVWLFEGSQDGSFASGTPSEEILAPHRMNGLYSTASKMLFQ